MRTAILSPWTAMEEWVFDPTLPHRKTKWTWPLTTFPSPTAWNIWKNIVRATVLRPNGYVKQTLGQWEHQTHQILPNTLFPIIYRRNTTIIPQPSSFTHYAQNLPPEMKQIIGSITASEQTIQNLYLTIQRGELICASDGSYSPLHHTLFKI